MSKISSSVSYLMLIYIPSIKSHCCVRFRMKGKNKFAVEASQNLKEATQSPKMPPGEAEGKGHGGSGGNDPAADGGGGDDDGGVHGRGQSVVEGGLRARAVRAMLVGLGATVVALAVSFAFKQPEREPTPSDAVAAAEKRRGTTLNKGVWADTAHKKKAAAAAAAGQVEEGLASTALLGEPAAITEVPAAITKVPATSLVKSAQTFFINTIMSLAYYRIFFP